MPKIDFYLLNDSKPSALYLFACRLVEKAYLHKHATYIAVASQPIAEQLDNLLWTFKDNSFIPHQIFNPSQTQVAPIQISTHNQAPAHCDLLLNLTSEIPEFHREFNRIIEIVPNDDAWKAQSRNHFKFYREQGYEIQTHPIN
ncbi:MAG: DNA polymerase III subunit chi [Proteobacteria bacterium]|nr:DNA polymerase III subunit chi [Pseudomonadota bacterium]